jgi:hypothetical protein
MHKDILTFKQTLYLSYAFLAVMFFVIGYIARLAIKG